MAVGLGSGDSWGRNPQKGAQQTPAFRPMSIVAKRLDESRCHLLGTEVGYGDIVLDGDPAPPTKKGNAAPHFSGQTAVCIRIPQ